jgi:hypothetical protein
MDNVLFYGFSTIAATFGSAVGIIIADAIFRMQRIDQIAAGLAYELLKYHPHDEQRGRLNRIMIVQNWGWFLEVWGEYHTLPMCPPVQAPNDSERKHKWLLVKVIERMERIRVAVRVLVGATLALIALCFVGLGMTKCVMLKTMDAGRFWFCGGPKFNWALAATIALAVCLLLGYAYVTYLLTKANDYPES